MDVQDRVGWQQHASVAAEWWTRLRRRRRERRRTQSGPLYWVLLLVAICCFGWAVYLQLKGNLELARPLLLLAASALAIQVVYIAVRLPPPD
jgi:hypothetical protein